MSFLYDWGPGSDGVMSRSPGPSQSFRVLVCSNAVARDRVRERDALDSVLRQVGSRDLRIIFDAGCPCDWITEWCDVRDVRCESYSPSAIEGMLEAKAINLVLFLDAGYSIPRAPMLAQRVGLPVMCKRVSGIAQARADIDIVSALSGLRVEALGVP